MQGSLGRLCALLSATILTSAARRLRAPILETDRRRKTVGQPLRLPRQAMRLPYNSQRVTAAQTVVLRGSFRQRIASSDSPLPAWGEDEGEGPLFDLAKLRFDA